MANCDIWYIRFCLDHQWETLVLGNQVGKIYLWDLTSDDSARGKPHLLSHGKCTSAIRQVTVSRDGRWGNPFSYWPIIMPCGILFAVFCSVSLTRAPCGDGTEKRIKNDRFISRRSILHYIIITSSLLYINARLSVNCFELKNLKLCHRLVILQKMES